MTPRMFQRSAPPVFLTRAVSLAAIGISLAPIVPEAVGQDPIRVIALSGQPAVGIPNRLYAVFEPPTISNDGDVGYGAEATNAGGDSDFGFWVRAFAASSLILRVGDQPPGTPAGTEYELRPAQIAVNDSGQAGFVISTIDSAGDVKLGVFSRTTGASAQLVALDGSNAAGITGATYDFTEAPTLVQVSAGPVFTGNFLDSNLDPGRAIWRRSGTTTTKLVATEEAAEAGGSDLLVGLGPIAASPAGTVVFLAQTDLSPLEDSLYRKNVSAGSTVIAREGQTAPGTVAELFLDLRRPVINNAGRAAFAATLEADPTEDLGIWREGADGNVGLIARTGRTLPGLAANATAEDLSDPRIGLNGRISFGAKLVTDGDSVTAEDDTGLWGSATGSLQLVVREGNQAPGLPAGVLFSEFGYLNGWTANDAGQLAFTIDLEGLNVSASNDSSLWAQRPNGSLALVARKGDSFVVAAGDVRTIDQILFATGVDNIGSSLADGWNDVSQIAFMLRFDDGTQGVFVKTVVPEPGSVGLLVAGVVVLGAGRLGRRSVALG